MRTRTAAPASTVDSIDSPHPDPSDAPAGVATSIADDAQRPGSFGKGAGVSNAFLDGHNHEIDANDRAKARGEGNRAGNP
jgi:hypothetical protein